MSKLKDAIYYSNLKDLNLSNNPFNYKVAEALKQTLKIQTHSSLVKLNLSSCGFKWGAVNLILNGIKYNRTLKYLDLSANDCQGSTKFKIWEELFKSNEHIETLLLNNCQLGD